MASLTAHLRRPSDHARLPFHPECPLCRRDRLSGPLPPDALVGRRTQAFLAASVLAFSAATPTAVLAAEPDQEQEGAAVPDEAAAPGAAVAPDQATVEVPPSAPDFDPGGDSTDVPFDATPVPAPDATAAPEPEIDEAGPLEQEAATGDDAPVADSGDGNGSPAPSEQPAPPAQDDTPATPAPAGTAPQPPADVAAPETPAAAAPEAPDPNATRPPDDAAGRAKPRNDSTPRDSAPSQSAPSDSTPSNPAPSSRAPAASPPATPPATTAAPEPTTVLVAQPQPTAPRAFGTSSRGQAARPGDRVHVVAPGESLWSIAADILGDDASVARTARAVNRLWELNRSQIGTGNPNLLMVGTKLTLR
jgi:hypothetical protein